MARVAILAPVCDDTKSGEYDVPELLWPVEHSAPLEQFDNRPGWLTVPTDGPTTVRISFMDSGLCSVNRKGVAEGIAQAVFRMTCDGRPMVYIYGRV